MQMMLIHFYFFILTIARVRGLGRIWEWKNVSVSERTMKSILESCFQNDISSNPVVIIGNVDGISDKVPVIRIDNFLNREFHSKYPPSHFKLSTIVLMEDSPSVLESNVELLKKRILWDHMVPFFIIGKDTTSCESSINVLTTMWKMEILNSIYICAQSINNTSKLYTLNPIADYAPNPWRRIAGLPNLNVFHQNFDANISCRHLIYDKTKFLNGYPITAVKKVFSSVGWELGRNYFEQLAQDPDVTLQCLRSIIIALNASGRFEVEFSDDSMKKRYLEGTTDTIINAYTLDSFRNKPLLFLHKRGEMITVVKLKAEVSTLQKIRRLWSNQVLVLSAVVLFILFLILIIINRNFGLALLDITRLLIYTSIRTDARYHSFRIFFTTMLIFMIISNGVFQGKIAAFLTTREKVKAVESIRELKELGYEMYVRIGTSMFALRGCPLCEFKEVQGEECIDLVLNKPKHACVISKWLYEMKYILLDLDHSEEILNAELMSLHCRRNWPLHDRVNNMMMRLVQSGIPDFLWKRDTIVPKAKRQAMEAEWSSPEYRPVKLAKLKFAFQLLAVGLILSTIVFFLELCWALLRDCVIFRYFQVQNWLRSI